MADREISLDGMRALVTGGTNGLGLAMVRALTRAGATVAFTGRNDDRVRATEAQVQGTVGVVADARDEEQAAHTVAELWGRWGGIDLLVNNAGIGMVTVNPRFMVEPQGFWKVTPDGFRAVIDTNLTGYFLMAREVAPRMISAGHGRIVNISMNHSTMNRGGFVPYGPSRAGAEALSRIMAADLEGTGVTVNLLLPGGATRTGMIPSPEHQPDGFSPIDSAVMGPAIVWLASAEATDVHNQRIIATEFDTWLADHAS